MKNTPLKILIGLCFFNWFIPFAQNSEKPNIILIMTDDQGWFDAGFNGNLTLKTPNLDAIAKQGIVLDRFYSASAVCSPTRASVITGRSPLRMGIPSANSGHMKKQEITIAELVKQSGYATGHFGKWHLGVLTKKELDANRGGREKFFKDYSVPAMHGYDEYFCTESKVPTYDPMIKPEKFQEEESLRFGWTAVDNSESIKNYGTAYWTESNQKVKENLEGEDTRIIMDRVIPFIKKSVENKTPFFTTIWPHTPHLPVVANKKFMRKYAGLTLQQQLYYGSITAMDEQIGRLWKTLDQLGISNNTMIWFCSDNGPENKTPGSAGAFRERKRSLHEGGLRTPAFVVWKNKLKGEQRSYFPAFTSDYLPTILKILNSKYPDNRPLDGIDIMPFLENADAIREKPMGFIFKNQISWVNQQYKLISKDNGNTYELYHLLRDEKEEKNIAANHPELVTQMKLQLKTWLKSVDRSSKGLDY
ncbi:sulfatase family protein [Seonamhaeicola marinus]|uniref:Sulfatase-like hydrolase/transferase n=1 Tax=Seonamhaeicola marinus TaxID=1912246 RepID=A0A5D0HTH1_9FLAO|nr:sulfatase-like hydrolase/transferase [Seonamhaeicola marinus]TYA74654.1 sulfatase-like hydrolase/transferase [Seonamhaeicola marinus]